MEDLKKSLDETTCVICGEKLSFYSIGKCNHKEICYYCTIKNRAFYYLPVFFMLLEPLATTITLRRIILCDDGKKNYCYDGFMGN